MAKKSKTQRAKASAARAAKKAQEQEKGPEAQQSVAVEASDEKPKRKLFSKDQDEKEAAVKEKPVAKQEKKIEKPKKQRFRFLRDVRAELRRVTWPTKQDIFRWSIVVVTALVFFGVYVFLLDNVVVTPILLAISGLGA